MWINFTASCANSCCWCQQTLMSNVYWYMWIKTCVQQNTAAMPVMHLATNCQVIISTSPRHLCTRLSDVTHTCAWKEATTSDQTARKLKLVFAYDALENSVQQELQLSQASRPGVRCLSTLGTVKMANSLSQGCHGNMQPVNKMLAS